VPRSPFRLPSPARIRLGVQAAYSLFLLYAGWRFFLYVRWAMGETEDFVPKPPSVEGFLPISALIAFKRLLVTGQWDPVHPAGLFIFIGVLLMALLLRKGFCGYICPVGFVSSLLARLGTRLGIARRTGPRVARLLSLPKYLLLAQFAWISVVSMDVESIEGFLLSPYNFVADTRMLQFFLAPSNTALIVFAVLGVGSLLLPYFWCRVLCPYGALLSLLARLSPVALRRDPAACVDCGRCSRACPAALPVQRLERLSSGECVGCTECISACPVDGCLSVSLPGKRRLPAWSIAAGCVLVLLAAWGIAQALGMWDSPLPQSMARRFHMMLRAGMITH